MKVFIFLLMCCGVLLIKTEGIVSLKRIKRTDVEATHIPKASDDYATVKSRNSAHYEGREKKKGSSDHSEHSKEIDMYDKTIENFNATKDRAKAKDKSKGRKPASGKDNKNQQVEAIGSVATYILREQGHPANDHSHSNSPKKSVNEVVMTDNSPKEEAIISEGTGHINLRDNEDSGNVHNDIGHALHSDYSSKSADHGPEHVPYHGADRGTMSSAHVIIPQGKLAISRSNSPFEQMFRLANMFFYNLGRDTVPIHTQSASLTLMPLNTVTQTEFMAEEPDAFDYYYNTVESPTLGHHPTVLVPPSPAVPVPALPGPDQPHTILYGPPLVFKQPLPVNEPKNVLNVIENAIDTLIAGAPHSADSEDEIELHCPIHHEKKNTIANGDASEYGGKSDDGVIHVCSCRLIKKKKKNVKKQADIHHGDTRSLLHTSFI